MLRAFFDKLDQRSEDVALVLLIALTVVSGATTVIGAREVLPAQLGTLAGLIMQLMLLLLLAGVVARTGMVRRWFLIGVFATGSVYSSFFVYYDQIAGAATADQADQRARDAHAELVAAVYTPHAHELGRIEAARDVADANAQREASRGTFTGKRGYGARARKFADRHAELSVAHAQLAPMVGSVGDALGYDASKLGANAIFERDRAAWAVVPAEWKAGVAAPDRTAYRDPDLAVAFLAPFRKTAAGETAAVVALIIAVVFDGLVVVVVGGTLSARYRPSAVETASRSLSAWVTDVKRGWHTVRGAAARRPGAFDGEDEAEAALRDPARVIELELDGDPSEFLREFYDAIDPKTRKVDVARLAKHDNPSFAVASRVLLDRLRDPSVDKVRLTGRTFRVVESQYAALTRWLSTQIATYAKADDPRAADTTTDPSGLIRLLLPRTLTTDPS